MGVMQVEFFQIAKKNEISILFPIEDGGKKLSKSPKFSWVGEKQKKFPTQL